MPDIPIDPRRVRPISLNRNDVEPVINDQAPGDSGTGAIEFGGPVRSFAEKHNPGVAKAVKRRSEFVKHWSQPLRAM